MAGLVPAIYVFACLRLMPGMTGPWQLSSPRLPAAAHAKAGQASYRFLPYSYWYVPGLAWLCIPANGEGASAPFFLFLSCFGFFFSLLLRI
jgi:hypothetical protein